MSSCHAPAACLQGSSPGSILSSITQYHMVQERGSEQALVWGLRADREHPASIMVAAHHVADATQSPSHPSLPGA